MQQGQQQAGFELAGRAPSEVPPTKDDAVSHSHTRPAVLCWFLDCPSSATRSEAAPQLLQGPTVTSQLRWKLKTSLEDKSLSFVSIF